jgi:hypothetical protein
MGIPRAQLARVFEKYYRGDAAVARRVSGTGLGLYICKSIVEAHGGRVWAESQEGQGSVFHFALPKRSHVVEPAEDGGRGGEDSAPPTDEHADGSSRPVDPASVAKPESEPLDPSVHLQKGAEA